MECHSIEFIIESMSGGREEVWFESQTLSITKGVFTTMLLLELQMKWHLAQN